MTRLRAALATGAVLAALLSGCGYDDTPLPEQPEPAPTTPAAPADCTTTPETLRSYEPSTLITGKVEEIQDRGRLVVGVSADTYLMASANPEAGNKIEGFDIEFARAIGEAIFEDTPAGFEPGRNLQFRVITAADRIPLLQEEEVDLVIRNFTINCDRWQDIAFSQVYYAATQKVLVNQELADSYSGVQDLEGLSVCAPTGSTSLDNVVEAAERAGAEPPELEPAATHTGCLIKFQRGEVDAITGDDTVLAGLVAQDPYAVVPDQEPLNDEPYGIGANQEDDELVEFVNGVLEQMRDEGAWDPIYDRWLRDALSGVDATQPAPTLPYRT